MCYAFPLIFEKLLCSIKLLYSSKLLHRVQRQKRKILDWCYSKHWLQMVFYFLKADCWAIVIDPAICDIQQILRILSLSGFLSCGSVAGRNSVLAEQSPCETIPVLLKLLNLFSAQSEIIHHGPRIKLWLRPPHHHLLTRGPSVSSWWVRLDVLSLCDRKRDLY